MFLFVPSFHPLHSGDVEFSPIPKSQLLSKLCCRIPHHDKRPLFVVCKGASHPLCPRVSNVAVVAHTPCPSSVHGLLCSECMYEHNRTTCNIRPVKIVEIVEKWESAHKKIETFQSELKMIKFSFERDFSQASSLHSQAQADLFSSLRQRYTLLVDSATSSIAQTLQIIEDRLRPLQDSTKCANLLKLFVLFFEFP
jgi:hypothetical protein